MGNKQKKQKKEYNIFTLGISGAGKSTFAKQAQILYNNGFSNEQKNVYKNIIINNIIFGMKEVLNEMEKKEINFSKETSLKKARFIREIHEDEYYKKGLDWKDKIRDLWNDENVKNTWTSLNNPQLYSLEYHMDKLNDYCDINYIPTNEDILRARQRTTGQIEIEIQVKGIIWKITDVGGQKSEIEKWAQIMTEIDTTNPVEGRTSGRESDQTKKKNKVILFFVSLIDFETVSSSDSTKTNLKITEETFKNVIDYVSNRNNFTIILCFNKIDLFEKKVDDAVSFSKFKKEFPEYKTEKNVENVDSALKYIQERFKTISSQKYLNKENVDDNENELSIHVTCGLNTDLIQKTFEGISETLFIRSLSASGLKI
jgi:guanine nucleotide-binding protein G(i) subunit alpha